MQSALVDPEKFFLLLKESTLFPDEQVRFIERWMQLTVRKAKFLPAVLEVLEEAFLFGTGFMKVSIDSEVCMEPKVNWQPIYSDPQMAMQAAMAGMETMSPSVAVAPYVKSAIKCSKVHLRSMYPDPLYRFGEGRYVIERFETDREVLEEMVRLGIYDSLDGIGEGMKDQKYDRFSRSDIQDSSTALRKRDVVQEYTGNLYKDGRLACRNWIVSIGNESRILRIGPNPIWNGASRYACCTPIPFAGRPWGESSVEADAVVEVEMKALLDLMIDDTKYAVLGAFQIDETKNNDPEPITGIEPGRTYNGDGKFIDKLTFPSNANTAWPIMTHLQGIGDKSAMVNEFAAGTPSSRGRPTATEVQSKTGSATGHIHNMARQIENEFIEPALHLIYQYLLQFGDDLSPELDELAKDYGGASAMQDPVKRFAILDVPFRIQVRGISMLASREQLWQRLMQIVQMGQQMQMPPQDPVKLWYIMISSMGFSPEQIGYSESPEQYMAWQQAQMQAQQGEGGENQGGGGAPGGAVGASGLPPEAPTPPTGAPPTSDQLYNRQQGNAPSV